jgi:hypothetical protein
MWQSPLLILVGLGEGVGLEGEGLRGAHSPIPKISTKTFPLLVSGIKFFHPKLLIALLWNGHWLIHYMT